jgi:hypothetical protein
MTVWHGRRRMAMLGRMRGHLHRLGGWRGAWDQREAHGGGIVVVPWPNMAAIDVVPTVEGNGSGRDGLVAVAAGSRVGSSGVLAQSSSRGQWCLFMAKNGRHQCTIGVGQILAPAIGSLHGR